MGYFEDIRAIVRRIPRGRVASYGEVARAAGYAGAARQAAWALRGASAAGIPWQRVVGAAGKILLPGQAGLHQRLLLEMEGVAFSGARVRMDKHGFRFPSKPTRKGRRARSGGGR